MRKVFRAMGQAFQSKPPNRIPLPYPLNAESPWWFTAGPVFNPGAAAAILNSKLSKPWQTIFGYAYRVGNPNAFRVTQSAELYSPKGVSLVGINIQTGWTGVTTPAVNADGTFANQGQFAGASESVYANNLEGEW